MQSTNGTFINDIRLQPGSPRMLRINDIIGLGVTSNDAANVSDSERAKYFMYRVKQVNDYHDLLVKPPSFTIQRLNEIFQKTTSVAPQPRRRIVLVRRRRTSADRTGRTLRHKSRSRSRREIGAPRPSRRITRRLARIIRRNLANTRGKGIFNNAISPSWSTASVLRLLVAVKAINARNAFRNMQERNLCESDGTQKHKAEIIPTYRFLDIEEVKTARQTQFQYLQNQDCGTQTSPSPQPSIKEYEEEDSDQRVPIGEMDTDVEDMDAVEERSYIPHASFYEVDDQNPSSQPQPVAESPPSGLEMLARVALETSYVDISNFERSENQDPEEEDDEEDC